MDDLQPDQQPNVSVVMCYRNIAQAPRYALPAGYSMRFYHDGDVATWVRVQQAAETYFVPTAKTFSESMPGTPQYLAQRVMFLLDGSGSEVGTITAWNSTRFTGQDVGQIHWVALIPTVQGRGLSKPMLSAALDVLRERGYSEAWLETGTGRIPALNLYLHFGFEPYPRDETERAAWRDVAPRLKFPIAV